MPTVSNQRACKVSTCPNLTDHPSLLCEEHRVLAHKEYRLRRRDERTNRYYTSSAWRKLRKLAFAEHGTLCQLCLKEDRVVAAEVVHHLDELRKQKTLATSVDRLQPLCRTCHEKLHQRFENRSCR